MVIHSKSLSLLAAGLVIAGSQTGLAVDVSVDVLTFNVWHEESDNSGRQAIANTILASGADIVGMQEINAVSDGQAIADLLGNGWYYQHQGGDVAIYSKYQFVDTAPNSWGYKVEIATGQEAWVFNAHLSHAPYGPYQLNGIDYFGGTLYDPTKSRNITKVIRDQENARGGEMDSILSSMASAGALTGDMPVFLMGDFNEASHLDWTAAAAAAGVHVAEVAWPASIKAVNAGLSDSWRTYYPDEVAEPGNTWSPIYDSDYINQGVPEPQDRIDIIYSGGAAVVTNSQVMGPTGGLINEGIELSDFPSDHRTVVSTFTLSYDGGPNPPAGTILNFTGLPNNPGNDTALNDGYGDNASGTPNIMIAFSASAGDTWDTYTGGNWASVGQLEGGSGAKVYDLTLTPDAGFDALVESFELLDWSSGGTGHSVMWELIGDDGSGEVVLLSDTVTIRRRKSKVVDTGMTSGFDGDLILRLTHLSGDQDNLAVDNVAINQVITGQSLLVPEPSALLVLMAGGGLALSRRKYGV